MVLENMNLVPVSQCKNNLNFHPRSPVSPTLPPFCWNNLLISHFNTNESYAVSLQGPISDVVSSLYPSLSTPELGRLINKLKNNSVEDSQLLKLLKHYKVPPTTESLEILNIISHCPIQFQNWCSEKKVLLNNLLSLKVWNKHSKSKDTHLLEKSLNFITENNLSQQIGLKVLELSVDLLLMNRDLSNALSNSPENVVSELEKMRYPNTHKNDQEKVQSIQKVQLPPFIKGKWVRNGDTAGLEVSFLAKSTTDFEKRLSALTKNKEDICRSLWTPN